MIYMRLLFDRGFVTSPLYNGLLRTSQWRLTFKTSKTSMKQALSKFLAIKSFIYIIGFSILGYAFFTKTQVPSHEVIDGWYMSGVDQLCFETHCFDVEIADDDGERMQWLMNRNSLPSQSGMLFVFEEEKIYPFWMKNTLIPLDMIWIDHDSKVVDIQTAQPCKEDPCSSYTPAGSGLYVLELNAGISQLIGLQKWSMIEFKKK